MKWPVVAILAIPIIFAQPAAADPVFGCEGPALDQLECIVDQLAPNGICADVIPVGDVNDLVKLVGFGPDAKIFGSGKRYGFAIANAGGGPLAPGEHTGFVFIGALDGDCEVPPGNPGFLLQSVIDYWSDVLQ